ncbi:cell division protein ZapA [Pollutimonas sp. H1-120]|uniref:cell division protein ZapA n=1 Tax=Pollutimonas sp. H1-120 TaxID=3148824 RepID=UPI003B518954
MERVDVSILGRDYSLACLPAERESLLAAVRHVDQRMLGVKGSGKVSSNERIAVMAAIQIAAELLSMRAPDGPLSNVALGDFKRKIDDMNDLLDQVVGPAAQNQR